MSIGQRPDMLTIEEQHAAILSCCDDLLAALRVIPTGDVGQIRMRLAALLHANLVTEEAQIIGPLRRLAIADRPRLFTELSSEAANSRIRYSEHVGHWSPNVIAGNKVAYFQDAAELVVLVKLHLSRKRAVLADWRRMLATINSSGH